jgi:hypothetical protein
MQQESARRGLCSFFIRYTDLHARPRTSALDDPSDGRLDRGSSNLRFEAKEFEGANSPRIMGEVYQSIQLARLVYRRADELKMVGY